MQLHLHFPNCKWDHINYSYHRVISHDFIYRMHASTVGNRFSLEIGAAQLAEYLYLYMKFVAQETVLVPSYTMHNNALDRRVAGSCTLPRAAQLMVRFGRAPKRASATDRASNWAGSRRQRPKKRVANTTIEIHVCVCA